MSTNRGLCNTAVYNNQDQLDSMVKIDVYNGTAKFSMTTLVEFSLAHSTGLRFLTTKSMYMIIFSISLQTLV